MSLVETVDIAVHKLFKQTMKNNSNMPPNSKHLNRPHEADFERNAHWPVMLWSV